MLNRVNNSYFFMSFTITASIAGYYSLRNNVLKRQCHLMDNVFETSLLLTHYICFLNKYCIYILGVTECGRKPPNVSLISDQRFAMTSVRL